ncbi:helix-turn-helix transcriptional regulator [Streptococcus suis]|uniref:helix-turn-helix transcriptional regulator n=1 Tax=Streptococcus suis TaxID=1307 RepID=UPI000CF533DC|nr:helix-turn-helix transcriptional regulator [Streptococcus suis]
MICKRTIRELLALKNIKKSELARQCHVSPQTVSSWCTGRHVPSGRHLESICRVLEVPVQELDLGITLEVTQEIKSVEYVSRPTTLVQPKGKWFDFLKKT